VFDRFTLQDYDALLQLLREDRANLCFADHRQPMAGLPSRFFILRHDVDFSPEAALQMARFEAERGIRATYFLLLSSPHYNLLSEESRIVPRRLVELGHEVGLHYDVQAMAAGGDLGEALRTEVQVLSALTGRPVFSIAMHNPSLHGEDPFRTTAPFINAYADRFTKDVAYHSDSCGAWRDSTYDALRTRALPPRVQLLIHPFFWQEVTGSRWERLESWTAACETKRQGHVQQIRDIWLGHTGVHEHDRRAAPAER
jgi:hypothetical protein